ncbi:MAG: SurA N-terminal domain-containing protein [Janthinobacterium lividum]
MLNSIRRGANSLVIRLLLGMIAFAFVGWGIKDALQGQNNYDLVTFSEAQNISDSDFYRAKSEEISLIQKQNEANLTEEDIKQLGLDKIVLYRLINRSIFNNIVNMYDLKLNEESIIVLLKKSPIFKDHQGNFDYAAVKSFLRNSNLNEQEYFKDLEQRILKNTLVTTFLDSFKVPEIMIKNVVDYMTEERSIELVQIDLKNIDKKFVPPMPSEKEVIEFYQKHKELFTTKELRSLGYIRLTASDLMSKIVINNDELKDFYNKNKDEFGTDNFDKVRSQIANILNQQKIDQLMAESIKNLEDDVAAGISIEEIAKKYNFQLLTMDNVTYETIANENSEMNVIADAVFEMSEGEILYPTEIKDRTELILVELKSVKAAKLEPFENIKEKASKLLVGKLTSHNNLKNFEKIAKNYKSDRLIPRQLEDLKNTATVKIDALKLVRSEIETNLELPQVLLNSIFRTKKDTTTQVIRFDDKAYFAYINQIKISDKETNNTEKKISNRNEIISSINSSLIEDLVNCYVKKNNMKVNFKDPVLEEGE